MGLTIIGVLIFLGIAMLVAGIISYGTLMLLFRSVVVPVPLDPRTVRDRAFLGSFILGSWFTLSFATGPAWPSVILVTAIIVGLPAMVISIRGRRHMPKEVWKARMIRFSIVWLLLTIVGVLLAHVLLPVLSHMMVDE